MVLLMLFAFVAGAGTALSPCVLPVLPAVLAVGRDRRPPAPAGRGRRPGRLVHLRDGRAGLRDRRARPARRSAANARDRHPRRLRPAAAVPGRRRPARGRASRASSPARPGRAATGSAPASCSARASGSSTRRAPGPILAGVITVSAAQDFTAGKLAVALAYAVGSVAVLYLFMIFGRRLADRLSAHRGQIQMAMGAVMVAVAVAMAADLDIKFQNAIADDLPGRAGQPHRGDRGERRGRRRARRRPRRWPGGRGGRRGRGGGGRAAARPRPGPGVRVRQLAQHPGRRAADDGASSTRRTRSCSSTSGPTPASTASARCRT